MIRGLYHNGNLEQRFFNVDDIATLCRISPKKVKQWLSRRALLSAANNGNLVELAELLAFLIHHNMPVPSSLLPPKAGKILFIVAGDDVLQGKEAVLDRICRLFVESRNVVLAETSVLSRPTHLTILTFMPDVVVILGSGLANDDNLAGIVTLLAGLPATRTLLVVDDEPAGGSAVPAGLPPADLYLQAGSDERRMADKLRGFFAD